MKIMINPRNLLRNSLIFSIGLVVFLAAGAVHAETDLMILLDASGSMSAPGTPGTSSNKFDEVRVAVNGLLQTLPPEVSVGLRLMGATPTADCYFSFTFSTPSQGDRGRMQDFLDTVRPSGIRGLYQGIQDSLNDFQRSDEGVDAVVLVITDGGDGCERDMSVLAREYEFSPNSPQVIIYGLDLDQQSRDAIGIVVRATGGRLTNIDDLENLPDLLESFASQFENNLRIYLQDNEGSAVIGDVVIEDADTGGVVSEVLDVSDYSTNLEPGTYIVKGRFRGSEATSDMIEVTEGGSFTVNLDFDIYVVPFTLALKDMYEQPLKGRVTFFNSSNEPVLTTELDTSHRVELPPGSYRVQIRLGDMTYDFSGIMIGPGFNPTYDLEVPVALGVLEVEVSNMWGTPLNAKIQIFDSDGTLMDDAPYSSYLYSKIPPGEYRVTVDFHGTTDEKTVTLISGDEMQVDMNIFVDLGDIFVRLRTESGNDAWGWVKLYDSDGNLYERYDRETIEQPEWSFTDIPVGVYSLEGEVEGIVRTITGVEVKDNEETVVELTFPDETY